MTTATSQFNFAFDVDGTLTPSRQRIAPSFEEWFLSFCQTNNVYLVSGSDYEKTLEQLGEEICNTVKGKGVSFMQNEVLWHYRSPQGDEYAAAISEIKENME